MKTIAAVATLAAVACTASAVTSYENCQVSVPSPYNAAWGCPTKCQGQNCDTEFLAPAGSTITRDTQPIMCSGVAYYWSSYYNFQGKLEAGYIAGDYLTNCGKPLPPPAPLLMASGESAQALPAPAPQGSGSDQQQLLQRRDTAAGPYPERQCKVPQTSYVYDPTTCAKEVQINAGSVVVDQGDDIVYSSKCDATYLRVEYMLMDGTTGYGYMRSMDLQC